MDISKIKQLIDLMEERTLAELTVQDGDKKVSISRHLPQANIQPVTATTATTTTANADRMWQQQQRRNRSHR